MSQITLFHTGYQVIQKPDVHYGRKNADFGQGFYMTADEEFAKRWARKRKNTDTFLNTYVLDLNGLNVRKLERNEEWFQIIYHNRNNMDLLPDIDVIMGPIANDTIYDTLGMMTSGMLEEEEAFRLLLIGRCYEQVVVKSERAVNQLKWISGSVILEDEILAYRQIVAKEEEEYQMMLAEALE